MGLFKKQVIKEIGGSPLWGYLFNSCGFDSDTLYHEIRYVERKGELNGGESVTFIRVFSLKTAQGKGVTATGWETFDEHPELILFEGYITKDYKVKLERKGS